VKRGDSGRVGRQEEQRIRRATCPGLVKQTIINCRMPEHGEALMVVMALVNLGAVERGGGVSATAISRETDGRVDEETVTWVCRSFVASGFAILEEGDEQCRDIQTRRFYLTTDAEVIAHEASMMRLKAQLLLGRAGLLEQAAVTSVAGVPMSQPDRAEKTRAGAEIKSKLEAA